MERPGVRGILLLHVTFRFYFLEPLLCLQDSRIHLLGNLLEDISSEPLMVPRMLGIDTQCGPPSM